MAHDGAHHAAHHPDAATIGRHHRQRSRRAALAASGAAGRYLAAPLRDHRGAGIKIAPGERHGAGAHDDAQSERPAGANHDRQSAGIPPARAGGVSTNGGRADTPTKLPATRHRSRHYGTRSKTPFIPAHSALKTRVNALMAGIQGPKAGSPLSRGRAEERVSCDRNGDTTRQHCCLFASGGSDSLAAIELRKIASGDGGMRMADELQIKVNGRTWPVAASPDTPLLYVLANELELKGPRFGCGLAQCGSCSVLADGVEIRSCVTPVAAVADKSLTTLEGLAALYAP